MNPYCSFLFLIGMPYYEEKIKAGTFDQMEKVMEELKECAMESLLK